MFLRILKKISHSKLWRTARENRELYLFYKKTIGKIVGLYKRKKSNKLSILMNKEIQERGMQVIQEIEKTLSNTSTLFFAMSGTLLGFVRDGKIISWDEDIDYGIYINDQFTWKQLEQLMDEIGFSLDHQFWFHNKVTEQSYKRGVIQIDFFNHIDVGEHTCLYAYYRRDNFIYSKMGQMHTELYKVIHISGTRILEVEGGQIHIPVEAEEYLREIYGEAWRVPDPNWVSGSGPACIKLSDDELGICERIG